VFLSCSLEKERTRIKLWTFEKGTRLSVLKGLLAKYEYETKSYEIRVKVFPSSSSLYSYFVLKAAQGKGPDILYIPHGWVARFASLSYLKPFPERFTRDSSNDLIENAVSFLNKTYLRADHVDVPVMITPRKKQLIKTRRIGIKDPFCFLWSSLQGGRLSRKTARNVLKTLSAAKIISENISISSVKHFFAKGKIGKLYCKLHELPAAIDLFKIDTHGRHVIVYGYGITSRSKKQETSRLLISYLLRKKHLKRFYTLGLKVSPYKGGPTYKGFSWHERKKMKLLPEVFQRPSHNTGFLFHLNSFISGEFSIVHTAAMLVKKFSVARGGN